MLVKVFLLIVGYFVLPLLISIRIRGRRLYVHALRMPLSIFIVTTMYSLTGVIWWLSADHRGFAHWAVGIGAIILWLGIYGKVRIKKPEPGFVGLALVLGRPVAHFFQEGINFLWQRGERYVGVDLIPMSAQTQNIKLSLNGIPILQDGEPAGSIKIIFNMRARVNWEQPELGLRFFYNGLMPGVLESWSDDGSVLSQAFRQLVKNLPYRDVLSEDPNIFVPIALQEIFDPGDFGLASFENIDVSFLRFPREGVPDMLEMGIRVFSFGLSEVSLERGEEGGSVAEKRMKGKGMVAMADALRAGGFSDEEISNFVAMDQGAKGTVVLTKKGARAPNVIIGGDRRRYDNDNENDQDDHDDDDDN